MKNVGKFAWAFVALLGLGILVPAGGVLAEDGPKVDCKNPMTQMAINICSYRDFQAADKELNAVYKKVRQRMREWDAGLPKDQRGAEKALVKGQRAWVNYRNGLCEAWGYSVHGGSMEPFMVNACEADLTRTQTKQLNDILDGVR